MQLGSWRRRRKSICKRRGWLVTASLVQAGDWRDWRSGGASRRRLATTPRAEAAGTALRSRRRRHLPGRQDATPSQRPAGAGGGSAAKTSTSTGRRRRPRHAATRPQLHRAEAKLAVKRLPFAGTVEVQLAARPAPRHYCHQPRARGGTRLCNALTSRRTSAAGCTCTCRQRSRPRRAAPATRAGRRP